MTKEYKTYLILFIISILALYGLTIYFVWGNDWLVFPLLLLIDFIILIILTIKITKKEPIKSRKKYYSFIAIGSVLLYFYSYRFQGDVADYLLFKPREKALTTLVKELQSYKKLKRLSYGDINRISYTTIMAEVDTTEQFGKTYLLDDVLKREGIDKTDFKRLENLFMETNAASFTTLEDGTISFTYKVVIDLASGLAYSETGEKPDGNDRGSIRAWKKIGNNWYVWGV